MVSSCFLFVIRPFSLWHNTELRAFVANKNHLLSSSNRPVHRSTFQLLCVSAVVFWFRLVPASLLSHHHHQQQRPTFRTQSYEQNFCGFTLYIRFHCVKNARRMRALTHMRFHAAKTNKQNERKAQHR